MDESEMTETHKLMKKALDLKDLGNTYFKQKDYAKAISKYCKVELYIKTLAPKENAGEADPTMSMIQGMKQHTLTAAETKTCHDL